MAALAVHGRYVPQKPREPAHWGAIGAVASAVACPVLANGDVFSFADFGALCAATGAASAMAGRGAQWNASIFRRGGPLPGADVRRRYARLCGAWDNPVGNTKHCLREMLIADPGAGLTGPEGAALAAAKARSARAAAVFARSRQPTTLSPDPTQDRRPGASLVCGLGRRRGGGGGWSARRRQQGRRCRAGGEAALRDGGRVVPPPKALFPAPGQPVRRRAARGCRRGADWWRMMAPFACLTVERETAPSSKAVCTHLRRGGALWRSLRL